MIKIQGKWSVDPRKLVTRARALTLTHHKRIILRVYDGLVTRSPVLSGRFRANWKLGIGRNPDVSHIPKSAGKMRRPDKPSLAAFKLGDRVYIKNGQAYAQKIENGSSEFARGGVIKPTLASLQL